MAHGVTNAVGGIKPRVLTKPAGPNHILKGYESLTPDGKFIQVGTLEVQNASNFRVTSTSTVGITFAWTNPATGPYNGIIIIGRTDRYPGSPSDGTRYYAGIGNNAGANATTVATINSFAEGQQYYFRAFSFSKKNNADWIQEENSMTAAGKTLMAPRTFTSSTTFTMPNNAKYADIFCVGGGASGSMSAPGRYLGSGGGGGGYTKTVKRVAVTGGAKYSVIIGAGGARIASSSAANGNAGGTTSFGNLCSAAGGSGSTNYTVGSKGGSGGGGAGYVREASIGTSTALCSGGAGGSNGSNGTGSAGGGGGAGQTTTTRAFGESNGTIYAGGGGGAGAGWIPANWGTGGSRGPGGSGGGGASGTFCQAGYAGTAGTGGGGGASGYGTIGDGGTGDGRGYLYRGSGAGGSGIIIIRLYES